MSYTYKRPEGRLTKIPIRKWNKTFAYRGKWPKVAYVYYTDESAMIHYKLGLVGKTLILTTLPLIYLMGVFQVGHGETVGELKGLIFQNQYGSFTSDYVHKNSNSWFKLKALLGHYD